MEKKANMKAPIVSAGTKFSRAIFTSSAAVLLVVSMLLPGAVLAQSSDEKIEQLQKTVESLTKKIESLEARQNTQTNRFSRQETEFEDLFTQVDHLKDSSDQKRDPAMDRLHFGGYGDVHATFGEGDGADLIDLHRLVLYLGYDFNDWIQFNSEWEIEHAHVAKDSDGYFLIEQAYFDFLLGEKFNVRAGRVLTPLGIINKWHEPTTFNSVERPSFAKYIIPSTWSSDGIGIFGNLNDSLSYEAYIVGGLDGSGFSAKNGIRGGRIKERPSLHEPAITGRIDYYAFGGEADKDIGCSNGGRVKESSKIDGVGPNVYNHWMSLVDGLYGAVV